MNINWEKIRWYSLVGFLLLLINACGIAILVMLFIDGNLIKGLESHGAGPEAIAWIEKENFNTSFFSDLDFKVKAGVIFGEVLGALCTYGMIKILFKKSIDDKREEKRTKETQEGNKKMMKDIAKYLGDKEKDE